MIRPGTSVRLVVSNQVGFMRTRTKFFLVVAAISFLAPLLRATDTQWPATLGTLKAKFSNIGTSNLVTRGPGPGARPRDVESGFVGQSTQTYVDDGGFESNMTLFTFKDSSGAYQDYLFLRSQPTDDPTRAVFVKGNRLLVVEGGRDKNQKSIEDWGGDTGDFRAIVGRVHSD